MAGAGGPARRSWCTRRRSGVSRSVNVRVTSTPPQSVDYRRAAIRRAASALHLDDQRNRIAFGLGGWDGAGCAHVSFKSLSEARQSARRDRTQQGGRGRPGSARASPTDKATRMRIASIRPGRSDAPRDLTPFNRTRIGMGDLVEATRRPGRGPGHRRGRAAQHARRRRRRSRRTRFTPPAGSARAAIARTAHPSLCEAGALSSSLSSPAIEARDRGGRRG